jgi:hypothetical protein
MCVLACPSGLGGVHIIAGFAYTITEDREILQSKSAKSHCGTVVSGAAMLWLDPILGGAHVNDYQSISGHNSRVAYHSMTGSCGVKTPTHLKC